MPPLAEIEPGLSGTDDEEDEDDTGLYEDMEAIRRACLLTGKNPDDLKKNSSSDGGDPQPSSDSDSDDDEEDLEAIRRACMITGKNPEDFKKKNSSDGGDYPQPSSDSDSDDDEDLELLRRITSRFGNSSESLPLKPLSSLSPDDSDDDDDEDDYQTLLAVQKRFAAYQDDTLRNATQQIVSHCKQVKKTCNERDKANDQSDSCPESVVSDKCSSFPKSAEAFMDAIKKNRSSQKFLRNKLIQIEAKISENKKLKERVKILRDFQISCKKRTGEALSQKKDPRVQLVSVTKPRASKGSKAREKKGSAMLYGPEENSHVANYKMTMTTFLHSLDRKKWSKEEKRALEKGIRQQFQEMVLQFSVDESSYTERPDGDTDHIDDILASIKDLQITPENIREFLPKVNWEQLASMYLVGRSSGECESRWLNWEDPLVNHGSWTAKEDKNLLYLVQKKGIDNWFDIAVSLGTNRTPFQCLARYQRSLNASILKREWTKDEDEKLRSAVEAFGEHDWQSVASVLGGRAGTQCSNRWKKTLHPMRQRQGKWSPEEDKRLKVAQMLFGPKNWNKTAQFVPGRTQAQCRDRYVNVLEPSLNWGAWSKEEDSKLRAAIAEHGYCWSKVAACVPRRTDNMCLRRWKLLSPDEVSLLREVKIIKRAALMCNFVDRETERPAIGPNDFLPPTDTSTKTITYPRKQKLRRGLKSGKKKNVSSCKLPKKSRPRRERNNSQSLVEVPAMVNCDEVETCAGQDASIKKKKVCKLKPRRRKCTEPIDECQVIVTVPPENDTQEEPWQMSWSDQIAGPSDGDNTTLPCFTQTKSKKSRPRRERNNSQSLVEVPGMVNCDEVETCDGQDASIKKKEVCKLQPRRRKCTEPTEECQVIVTVPPENGTQEERRQMSWSDQIAETSDGDDTTLACFIQTKSKKRKLGSSDPSIRHKCTEPTEECQVIATVPPENDTQEEPRQMSWSDQIAGASDGDDTTLACFIQTKSKKRKLGPSETSINKKKRKLLASDSVVQDCGMTTLIICDNQCGRQKLVRGQKDAFKEPERKVVGVNLESDDDILLASLDKMKLKKRHPQSSKWAPQACPPLSSRVGSESVPKRDHPNEPLAVEPLAVGLGKLQQEVDHCKPVRNTVKIGAEGDDEAGDMTLASFLRKKSKKRRCQSSKGHIQGSALESQFC